MPQALATRAWKVAVTLPITVTGRPRVMSASPKTPDYAVIVVKACMFGRGGDQVVTHLECCVSPGLPACAESCRLVNV
jgi:hypothetical protein